MVKGPQGIDGVIEGHRKLIKERGWSGQCVLPSPSFPGYAYTIGLTRTYGHPEVVLVGSFPPRIAMELLAVMARQIAEGAAFRAGSWSGTIADGFEVPLRAVDPEALWERLLLVGHCTDGMPFEAVQVFLPDPEGRYPDDPGCLPEYADTQVRLYKGPQAPLARRLH